MNGYYGYRETEELRYLFKKAESFCYPVSTMGLWLTLLGSSLGKKILEKTEISYKNVLKASTQYVCDGRDEVNRCFEIARHVSQLTGPPPGYIESLLYAALINPESELTKYLESKAINCTLLAEMALTKIRSSVLTIPIIPLSAKTEGEFIKSCLRQMNLVADALNESGIDLEELVRQTKFWTSPLSGIDLKLGLVTSEHFVLGLLSSRSVVDFMATLGITRTRLEAIVEEQIPNYPYALLSLEQDLPRSLVVAREEAVRLGLREISPELILWGMAVDERNEMSKIILSLGISREDLKNSLPESIERYQHQVEYSQAAFQAIESAKRMSELSGQNRIQDEYLLRSLVSISYLLKPYRNSLVKALDEYEETRVEVLSYFTLNNIVLGMLKDDVLRELGEPTSCRRSENEVIEWRYEDTTAIFINNVLHGIIGDIVLYESGVALQRGSPMSEVYRIFGDNTLRISKPMESQLTIEFGLNNSLEFIIWRSDYLLHLDREN